MVLPRELRMIQSTEHVFRDDFLFLSPSVLEWHLLLLCEEYHVPSLQLRAYQEPGTLKFPISTGGLHAAMLTSHAPPYTLVAIEINEF